VYPIFVNFPIGDFNLRDSPSLAPLIDILQYSQCVKLVNEPTRVNSLPDLIITNNSSIVESSAVYYPKISDHCSSKIMISIPKVLYEAKRLD
jgi:hypothetical protein